MTAQARNAASEPLTLGDINRKLSEAGFPIIPPEKAKGIISPENRDRFVRSVFLAREDPQSFNFVTSVLKAAQLITPKPQKNNLSVIPSSTPEMPRATTNEVASDMPDNQGTSEWGESFHVYGSKAALCFSEDKTKSGSATIALDAASLVAPKSYDWKNKIRIQLTKAELPVVAAVLLGDKQECEFKNHGANNDKGFSLKRQEGGKIFASVFAKGQTVKAVPIYSPDVTWVTALLFEQIQKNCPSVDGMSLLAIIRATQKQG